MTRLALATLALALAECRHVEPDLDAVVANGIATEQTYAPPVNALPYGVSYFEHDGYRCYTFYSHGVSCVPAPKPKPKPKPHECEPPLDPSEWTVKIECPEKAGK